MWLLVWAVNVAVGLFFFLEVDVGDASDGMCI